MTDLCKLAFKYGTDKCPQIYHSYTPIYYEMFKDKRDSVKKVLEMGIDRGASLRMWRDFFPNATIYGADNDPGTLFEEDRIETYFCDERNEKDVRELTEKIGDIDIFIDDGSHYGKHQANLCLFARPSVKGDYVIEDVMNPGYVTRKLRKYSCEIIKLRRDISRDTLVVVNEVV